MIYILSIIGLLLCGLSISCIYIKKNLLQVVTGAFLAFLFLYILNSAVLFYLDRFSINKTCLIIVIEMIIIAAVLLITGKRPSISLKSIEIVFPLVIFLLVLPVIFQKFGFFGMGQDEGVYQTKAIALINGHNENDYALKETEGMTGEQIDLFKNGISEQYGFYYTDNEKGQPIQGVFHGINTYPAVLAWWGSMFGTSNMASVHTVLFLCALCVVFDLGKLFSVSFAGRLFMTVIYAASPVILWVNKSTLTENITTLVFLTFLYMLFDEENYKLSWMAGIPVAVYAVFHVMIYVMMPLFTVCFLIRYFSTGNKRYLAANIMSVVAYRLGYMMMMTIATDYTAGNYNFINRLGITEDKVPLYVTMTVIGVVVLNIVLYLLPYKKELISKMYHNVWLQRAANWILRVFVALCAFYAIRMTRNSLFSYVNATMYAYVAATAIIIIPFILVLLLFRTKMIYQNEKLICLTFVYLYCGIFYSTVLSPFVGYYNYYSRYITVFIGSVLLLAVCLFEQIFRQKELASAAGHGKWTVAGTQKMTRIIYIVVAAFAVIIYVRYDIFMINRQDETRVQWTMMDQVNDLLSDKDALIIDGDLKNQLFYTTKLVNDNRAYPIMMNLDFTMSLADQINDANKTNGSVYYVSYKELGPMEAGANRVELVKTVDDSEQIYEKEVVSLGKIPYPQQNYTYWKKVYVYKMIY